MQLGFKRVGAPYPLSALSPMERVIAAHMMQLGLLLPYNVGREVSGAMAAHSKLPGSLANAGLAAMHEIQQARVLRTCEGIELCLACWPPLGRLPCVRNCRSATTCKNVEPWLAGWM